ncbi:MAG: radical SAM protein, partial [Candidatus Margulisbacteria bacterium]|nr:radical SAM protein [Candidatus Margulisiibacteriota bacterium]
AMMFNPVHSFLGRSQQQDHSAKRDVDLMAFAKNYLRVKQKADKEGIYLVSDFLPDFYQYIPRNYQCDACKSGVGVYGNGDICSCTRAYDLGEGFSNPFVWANIALDVNIDIKNEKALKQRVTEKMPECSHCLLKWNCAGDCLLQCYQLNGDMYKVYADRCKAKIHYIVEYLKVVIGVSNFKESLKVANKDVVLIHFPAVTPMLPPPGVNYLANYLLNKGVRCEVIDVNKDMYFQHKENWSKTFSFQKNYQQDSGFEKFIDKYLTGIAEIVLNNKYKHVGLSCFDNTFDIVKKTLEIMKEKGIKNIFLGGPDVFMEIETYKDLLRKNFVSALILKEGEYKVLEYVQGNNRIKGVVTNNNIDEDVACFKDEKTIKTSEIPCLEKMSGFIDGVFSHQVIPICASRGCSSNCSFCSHKILWDGYRLKETQDVINEMQFYQKKYSCNLFYFTDMLLNGSSIWLKDFVYKLLHLEDKMYWSAYVRIDPMFNEEFCFNIAKAGAVYLSFGIESNSQRVLDIVNKGTKVEDNEMVVANVAKAGIFIHASFILGLPYEEVADVLVTLEFIKRNIWNIDHVEIFFFENLPQSSGFELAKEYLEQKADKDYYQLKKQLYEEIIVDFNRIGSGFLSSRQLYSGEANNFKKGLHEFYRKKYLGEQPLGDEKFLENAERIHSFKLAQIKLLDEYMGKISSSFVQ